VTQVEMAPLRGVDARVEGVLVIGFDVTDRADPG
jgi:hypothetical protein